MNRFAAVDIGNTVVKVTFFEGTAVSGKVIKPSVGEAVACTDSEQCDAVAWCHTGSVDYADRKMMESAGWWEFSMGGRPYPISLRYASENTLGADRFLAAIGAVALEGNKRILIIDAGTALTLDIVEEGEFRGGNISPGLKMRFRALHEFTSGLPLEKEREDNRFFGDDTASSITCGVEKGMAWEIAGAISTARSAFGCDTFLVTGGDARFVVREMERVMPGVQLSLVPDLVAFGLKEAYFYYHDK